MKTLAELGIDESQYENSFVFLWGFNPDGNPYLDILAHGAEEIASSAVYLSMRERFQCDLKFGHIRTNGHLTKNDIYDYVDSAKIDDVIRRDVIEHLTLAGEKNSKTKTRGIQKPTKPETFLDSLRELN